MSLNEDLLKEFIVLVMGPLVQFVFSIILTNINFFSHYKDLIIIYNYTILGFNLLPIYPLDGGKIVNILLSSKLSFKKSLSITLIISYLTVFIFGLYFMYKDISLNVIIIVSFLLYKVGYEWKNKKYMMDKFLLERYLYKYKFKKRKEVTDFGEFMRNRNHLILKNGKYYTEKEILSKKFNNKC